MRAAGDAVELRSYTRDRLSAKDTIVMRMFDELQTVVDNDQGRQSRVWL